MPVEKLANTIPVAAILVAMCAAAVAVGLVDLAQAALELKKTDPTHQAMLFWPEFGGAPAMALVFGALVRTRWIPVLALGGMAVLVGVGSSVAPALFTAGFTLPSPQLPRVFALIELLRGVAAFLAGPLLLHMSETVGATPAGGIESAVWVCFGIALVGGVSAWAIRVAGRARLQTPTSNRGWKARSRRSSRRRSAAEAASSPTVQARGAGYRGNVATRAQVRELLDSGLSYEMAARQLGIPPGLAYMIATGRPADDDSAPAQDLFEPPPYNPTRNQRVLDWVKERAAREAGGG